MNKRTRLTVASVILLVGGAGAAWALRDRFSDPPKRHPARGDYDAMVAKLGGDEPAIRDELNFLASTASAKREPADQTRANSLTRECLDPNTLLEIGHVRSFVGDAAQGKSSAFHFVSDAHRKRLRELVGDEPSTVKVLWARRSLANLAAEFQAIRLPPTWSVNVEGEDKPRLVFLDLLREGRDFHPAGQHPNLPGDPRIPAFAGSEGELLDQLDRFFNGPRARAAFPPAKFPKLYRDGRIPPIPTALAEYRQEIHAAMEAEKPNIFPVEKPVPGALEAIDDVYAELDQFFAAIIEFGK
jgi:hypothetical protein